MAKKVIIQTEECMGCEACVEIAPNTFEFDEENNIAIVKNDSVDDLDAIEESIDSCPADCIEIIDED